MGSCRKNVILPHQSIVALQKKNRVFIFVNYIDYNSQVRCRNMYLAVGTGSAYPCGLGVGRFAHMAILGPAVSAMAVERVLGFHPGPIAERAAGTGH